MENLLIVYGLFTFCCVPAGYLAGLLVCRIFGDTYWYLTAVEVVGFGGMMAGGILMSTWGGFKRKSKTLTVGLAAFGLLAMGMGLCQNFALYLSMMLLYGVALTMVQTAITTMLQEQPHISMQGRVFGLMSTMYAGFLPVGMALFGPLGRSDSIAVDYDRFWYAAATHCGNGTSASTNERNIIRKKVTPKQVRPSFTWMRPAWAQSKG